MKVYSNGLIILDPIDIVCIGLLLGYSTGMIIKILKKYYSNKYEDPLISELKRISPTKKLTNYKSLKVPIRYFPRGGGQLPEGLKGFLLYIKNKRLAKLVIYLLKITKRIRELRRVKSAFVLLNLFLFRRLGIAFASGGPISHVQIILLVSTSSISGALLALLSAPGGFIFVLGPILTLINRYEYVPTETFNKCLLLCEAVKEYHNKELKMEMKEFTKKLATPFNSDPEQGPFQCTNEGKLYQRYLKNKQKIEQRVQNFNKFKEKFPNYSDKSAEQLKTEIEKIRTK